MHSVSFLKPDPEKSKSNALPLLWQSRDSSQFSAVGTAAISVTKTKSAYSVKLRAEERLKTRHYCRGGVCHTHTHARITLRGRYQARNGVDSFVMSVPAQSGQRRARTCLDTQTATEREREREGQLDIHLDAPLSLHTESGA